MITFTIKDADWRANVRAFVDAARIASALQPSLGGVESFDRATLRDELFQTTRPRERESFQASRYMIAVLVWHEGTHEDFDRGSRSGPGGDRFTDVNPQRNQADQGEPE